MKVFIVENVILKGKKEGGTLKNYKIKGKVKIYKKAFLREAIGNFCCSFRIIIKKE